MKNLLIFFLSFYCICNNYAQTSDFLNAKPIQFYDLNQLKIWQDATEEQILFDAFANSLKKYQQFDWSNSKSLEIYLSQAELFQKADSTLYQAMGSEMLTFMAQTLQVTINNGSVNVNAPIIVNIIQRLKANGIYIDVKTSNFSKIGDYLKEGRFDYVFHKLTTTYKNVSLMVCLAVILIFLLGKWLLKVWKSSKKGIHIVENGKLAKGNGMFLLLALFNGSVVSKSCAQQPAVPLCEVLDLEQQLDAVENQIKQILKSIPKKDQKGLPPAGSVWDTTSKPSQIHSISCEGISVEVYVKEQLSNQLQTVTVRLKEVEKLQSIALSKQERTAREKPFKQEKTVTETSKRGNYKQHSKMERIADSHALLYEDKFACFIINPRSQKHKIDFLWKDASNKPKPLKSFAHSVDYLRNQKKKPIMLMNAGIFGSDNTPLGYFCADSKVLHPFNPKSGKGNFYMEPAGVFLIDKNNVAMVKMKADYNKSDATTAIHGTQSGPMLVVNGDIPEVFNSNSSNRHIRNGVGVMNDGNIVFVLSKQPVTFYEFAEVFKNRFQCQNALYLDGTISQMYLPELHLTGTGGNFAGIIAVSEVTTK